jgi:hypothetical protein
LYCLVVVYYSTIFLIISGTHFFPFYGRNDDGTLCIAFFASKVGKVELNIIYRNINNLTLTSTLTVNENTCMFFSYYYLNWFH